MELAPTLACGQILGRMESAMRTLMIVTQLAGCFGIEGGGSEATTEADCLRTYGDHCTCAPQCMTQAQLDAIVDFCDLGCISEIDWECGLDADGQCVVAD